MKFYTNAVPGNSERYLVEGYPWTALGKANVVDVGGSDGHVSISLARANPDLRFIVQDRSEMIESACRNGPSDCVDQVKFQAHDFFTPQPVSAEVYLFRWIFHDWPDKYVIKILQQLTPALKPGAKIVVNESMCPEPGSMPLSMERTVR